MLKSVKFNADRTIIRMLDEIRELGGFQDYGEIIRAGIRKIYRIEFPRQEEAKVQSILREKGNNNPAYLALKKADPKRYCELRGGRLIVINGRDLCQFEKGGLTYTESLD